MQLTDATMKQTIITRCSALFVACVLVVGSTLWPSTADTAFADVRKADIIMGDTVDSRGLSVASCPSIDAEYALVVDADGTVYFERNAYDATKIASITKVMTGIVALDSGPIDTSITVSTTAASVGESSAQLTAGDVMTLGDALKALLVSSGNDAAEAIAETFGAKFLAEQGTNNASPEQCVQAFVDRMNAKAADLKLQDSLFANPHGLDDGVYAGDHHSCAVDVGTMVRYAMQNQAFRDSVGQPVAAITVVRGGSKVTLELQSTDELLGVFEGACGVKTGFTDAAGPSFAAASNRGAGDLYAVVIHSSSEAQRFTDASTLLQWVYDHSLDYPLAHSPQTAQMVVNGVTSTVPLAAYVAQDDWVDVVIPATLADPNATVPVFSINGNISQSVHYNTVTGSVRAGDKLGTISFKQRNKVVATVDLIACEDVAAPNVFEDIGVWWDRLFKGLSGKPTVAESVLVNETPLLVDKSAPLSMQ